MFLSPFAGNKNQGVEALCLVLGKASRTELSFRLRSHLVSYLKAVQ